MSNYDSQCVYDKSSFVNTNIRGYFSIVFSTDFTRVFDSFPSRVQITSKVSKTTR